MFVQNRENNFPFLNIKSAGMADLLAIAEASQSLYMAFAQTK